MRRKSKFTHQFVEFLPNELADDVIYVSIEYKTAAHKCGCGCGNEVNTPLSPTGWRVTFDGVSVSLYPSIGNWGFPCQSHYWFEQNQVKWADRWTSSEIQAGRERDAIARETYYGPVEIPAARTDTTSVKERPANLPKGSVWQRIKGMFGSGPPS